ncbi:MAG: hypothetical protein KKB21_04785 [Nanoarchaeota archaeon]|nr:hypothetical protein [Nanoarchaeota archaeon]
MNLVKKASGHIETVLSFVIFISFVIFLFAIFPVYQPQKSEIGLDSAERGVINFAAIRVDYMTLVLNQPTSCFSYPAINSASKIIVRDSSGERVNAKSDGINWYISGSGSFYGVYYSTEFSEGGYDEFDSTDCLSLGEQGISYESGLERHDIVVSYRRVLELIELYKSSYESVRNNFSIPSRENFGFAITDLRGRYLLNISKSRPERTSVLVRNTPIQMVYENGTSVFGMLNIQSW